MDEDRYTDPDRRGDALKPRGDEADAVERAVDRESDRMPRSVRRRLDSCASNWLREQAGLPPQSSRAGWFVAGLCFVAAVAGWWPRIVGWSPADNASRLGQLSSEMARERLLASNSGRVGQWSWAADAGGTAGVTGDVVWDGASQSGFLQFRGLAPNDPARHQYQLWIVDAVRDDRFPVDGGVFDVPASSGHVVIPIHAALPVREPSAFVVTLEKRGGAVVSNREQVVAIARAAGR